MAVVVSHEMRRYPISPPGSSYSSSCLGGEPSYPEAWPREDISESSLSRSMRYAEPWLYGSVRAPGGFLLAPALVLCSCSEYLNGTKRSSKRGPTLCKKCKGTRFPLPSNDTLRSAAKFGTVRCHPTTPTIATAVSPVRPGTVRASSHSRPTILPSTDPYELMRRSRLSSENGIQFRIRSPSPKKELLNNKTPPNPKTTSSGRKSILECDINPYDLMSLEADTKNDSSVTLVAGQRVRVRPQSSDQNNYEDVKENPPPSRQPSQIPKLKSPSTNKPKGPTKANEKESESNRFKSILKKPTTFSDTDSSGGPERSPSPAHKNGSHFYLPMPVVNTPRKKVQFLVENELAGNEQQEDRREAETDEAIVDRNDESPSEMEEGNVYEEVSGCVDDISEKKPFFLRRSVSERLFHDTTKVVFHDTMALRTRSRRADSRIVFSDVTDLEKLDGIILERNKTINPSKLNIAAEENLENKDQSKPTDETDEILKELQSEADKLQFPQKELSDDPPELPPKATRTEPEPSLSKNEVSPDQTELDTPPVVPPRKKSNSKQPLTMNAETSNQKATKHTLKIESTSPVIISQPLDYQNKTIVQITAPPTFHKIQIRNEFPESSANIQTLNISDNAQRKTSIMINGDDCYSTINVNDDVPLYQSSVVVNDSATENNPKPNRSSSVYITGNFAPLTVPNANKQLTPTNTEEPKPDINLKEEIKAEEELKHLLKDPVEAVKRNLVPHVCGRSDVSRRPRDKKLNNFTAPLLENHVETNINKLIEDSLLKLRNYESIGDDVCSEHSSSTPYELMDPGSDCYTDHSNRSSVTEEELQARTKFYEMLADSAIAEISESEDHHYESIKLNSDPIYEEISPPPLPSNPPPNSIIDDLQLDKQFTTRSIFEGASKYDILSYLVDAKERGIIPEDSYNFGNTDVVVEEDAKEVREPYRVSHLSSVSDSSEDNSLVITNGLPDDKSSFQKSAEVERNDSGVGSETSKSSLSRFRTKSEQILNCEDCETIVESISESEPLICRKCLKKRSERKEIITEIVETEEKYSRDLQIILEEFYQPMLVAGLLTPEQLGAIFLNVEELLENSQALAERLRDAVEIAIEQGDEDLLTVNIGKLFLEAAPMLHAFESYCIRQGNASLLLAGLEKEKELLRIFLRVSQMENTMLRRMNLNSFLMVPVQRVTKYPLLLTRLYKSTPAHHETRDQLKEAQHKIELHLNHMNSETKDVPSKLWRRIGSSSGRRSSTEMDLVSIKLRKIAVDVLEWNHDEAKFALEGRLLFTQPTDNNWRKGRTIKLAPINALLVTNGKTITNRTEDDGLCFPKTGVREAALLLVRDKNGRYSLLREPLYLDRCIIATDPAWQSYFEVQEVIGKDTFIFKAEDDDLTRKWYRQLQYHAQGLGGWRKRRNALANIMINGMGLRS